VSDPSTESWRATLGQSTSAQLRETQTAFEDTLEDLLRTQKALAASQADLTAAKAESADWRATAERYLAAQEQLARELATARYRNRILTAEHGAALRRLNEKEEQCPPTPPS
jgi:peptidoglycan hydrolase CwlO-like protein